MVSSKLVPSAVMARAIPRLESLLKEKCADAPFPILSEALIKRSRSRKGGNADSTRRAAVLIPICSVNSVPSILFTRRSPGLKSHASQVSFPGGHFEEGVDATLTDTALREASEELSGNCYNFAEHVYIPSYGAQCQAIPSLTGTMVTPVLAILTQDLNQLPLSSIFPGNVDEVDLVFHRPIADLLARETSEPLNRLGGTPGPVFPHFDESDDLKIWGLTAIILRPVLHKLLKPVFLDDLNNDSSIKHKTNQENISIL
eukprot:scaffold98018_cov48-Attheya_sp.AAC.5